jgi:putative phosphoribosyl transferase
MFADRREAGASLLAQLPDLDPAQTVVVALPRGGLPVAEVIAQARGLPLDIALVRKVGVPGHPELAVAAVTDAADGADAADGVTPRITVNADVARGAGLDTAEIRRLAERELPEIARRRARYLGGRAALSLAGKTVLVVDDGIATGATMRAALALIRAAGPARLLVAVPVAPPEALAELRDMCDDVICLECPRDFRAVGAHYRDFAQVGDAEVIEILTRTAPRRTPEAAPRRAD